MSRHPRPRPELHCSACGNSKSRHDPKAMCLGCPIPSSCAEPLAEGWALHRGIQPTPEPAVVQAGRASEAEVHGVGSLACADTRDLITS